MNTKPIEWPRTDSATPVRTLRRIPRIDDWPNATDEPVATRLAIVDCETDGLDPSRDNVIQIAVAIVGVSRDGRILQVVDHGTGLADPGRQIPARITKLTGIDNLTVRGKRIKQPALTEFICQADAVLAHNAGFDSGFCRRLLPSIEHLPWICSFRDVDWLGHRFDGGKLGHLLMQLGQFAPTAHDAMADVEALMALLQSELPTGETVLAEAMRTAQVPTVRIFAERAPYETRHELKRFGYRWNPDQKVWWTEVAQADVHAELALLLRIAPGARPTRKTMTWHTRHWKD
ncbi:3'-5' exonuclease [Novosphingopyxis sp. YJ-S2-01]|uniref:3'-5' exonuclease n=1 Tax=Novosphingopyxis sp. YJ-S2-01 TaxID=2794021 RepID=UPI0018DCB181|nr:3'-5' exonuclease [Novosphingopyxis sp. YJ-S2-01]MBH9537061.1 DNA polymerase III subunit epsilon [Novosphingopyxis sp. YJ-S2-01]